MDQQQLATLLESPASASEWLRRCQVVEVTRGHQDLVRLQQSLPADLCAFLLTQLEHQLPLLSAPDLVLHTLPDYLDASLNPLSTVCHFERDSEELRILLRMFSTSPVLGRVLVQDPAAFELVRLTGGLPVDRDRLIVELRAEIGKLTNRRAVTQALHRIKRRELLRIAYGDVIGGQPIETVMQQISFLADAICAAALDDVARRAKSKYGEPKRLDRKPARFAIIALGKLGGNEQNYGRQLELLFLYDGDGQTDGEKRIPNDQYFERLTEAFCEVLGPIVDPQEARTTQSLESNQHSGQVSRDADQATNDTDRSTEVGATEPDDSLGNSADPSVAATALSSPWHDHLFSTSRNVAVYQIDTSTRPGGRSSPRALQYDATLHYYDWMGRTWERQAFIKARPIAGDLALGQQFLVQIEPWIYRRCLSRADITGIKAHKRRIERRAQRVGANVRNIDSGHGGIRDVEFVIQFLQLINGGELPILRTSNTIVAIDQLHAATCLNDDEHQQLLAGYRFLRRLEHAIQITSDTGHPDLPIDPGPLKRLAINLEAVAGAPSTHDASTVLTSFLRELARHQSTNRAILNHILDDVFADSTEPEPAAEFDLILDPAPPQELIEATLRPFGFADSNQAYQNLVALTNEKSRFLSTRRCRHALATIAPELLRELSQTADPDAALTSLCRVSDSLGGKGVLWELFNAHPPSLRLYVRLCSASPYLSTILVSNPGMLDELMDSLALKQLPTRAELDAMLDDWCRGAANLPSLLLSFKNVQHLNAGVRQILGKTSIRQTTAFLADVAQACVQRVCDQQFTALINRYGEPWNKQLNRRCELVVVALGKLGGREPNYHSDLDVLFLYECEGVTRDARSQSTTNRSTSHPHFFNELAQRVTKAVNELGPQGRLYELDTKLRPTGQLAMSLGGFSKHYAQSTRTIADYLSLCRARPIYGSEQVKQLTRRMLTEIVRDFPWTHESFSEIRSLRDRLEQDATPRNLKRSAGGLVDIELLVQAFQLKHGAEFPEVLETGTTEGLAALESHQLITGVDAQVLRDGYSFLRSVEARLRLMNSAARHDLPSDARELRKLASLTDDETAQQLEAHTTHVMQAVRAVFERLLTNN